MSHKTKSQSRRGWKDRALSLLLSAAMLLGLTPGLTLPASAHWADEYLDQLVDWGVMRADQTGSPDAPITRADFAAIVNRAYGYTEKSPGELPFTDVSAYDWFYDDISIAYNTGYMAGTSATTASPNDTLTREQGVFILGRNMMLKETPGESLAFADSRSISTWASGMIKTAVDNYIVSGYPNNTFGPKDPVTKGQMAVLITQCIGTPVQGSGVHSLGGVFGNVTITSPNVTLRDTTISGDLYISGGVGLGGVLLENVEVLGRIVVSSAGESESGDASVVMRNVTADEMLVDSMSGKTVTVRADGITEIAKTTVRTDAYLEDNNSDDKGLLQIVMDDEDGINLTLAGRVKEVVDKSAGSVVRVAKGTVQKLTIDEEAENSQVILDINTEVKELNLDVGTNVIGQGDISKLNINAPGSNVAMLPDDIYIRPGLTAIVNGQEMDSAAAEEVSRDPRILSGYPVASDVAPTSLQGLFSTNKRGTIYWAVSSISDGSIEADDLISPPSYGSLAIQNGSVSSPAADEEVRTQISNLTSAGSYYLSAVLVDGQSRRSPVKVIAFSTPDNSVPAFAQGYPYMSMVTDTMAQVTVMPTKSCKLYYAVLPRGGQAPTANDMKTASVTGNLGYGVVDVVKNTERVINVSNRLEELKDYTLYLWLTDADGMNSSQVQALQFRTEDRTPPLFDPDPDPNAGTETETSVTLTAGLNEAGTIYWAVVPEGQAYPLPNNQSNPLDKDNILDEKGSPVSAKLDSDYAKLQVQNGRSATKRGSVAVRDANTDATINITGLTAATSYDLYYVAVDAAGNYSETVKKITIRTVDTEKPLVRQYFSNYQGEDETRNPMANSDIILEFSENVTAANSRDLLSLYNIGFRGVQDDLLTDTEARAELYNALVNNFKLYQVNTSTNQDIPVTVWDSDNPNEVPPASAPWINYRRVVVRSADGGKIEVVFPNGEAVALTSGARYHFEITDIRDNANNQTNPTTLNPKNCEGTDHVLGLFDTVFAQVNLATGDGVSLSPTWVENKKVNNEPGKGAEEDGKLRARVDASFLVNPQSTHGADENIRYELILFTDSAVNYDLYYRIVETDTKKSIVSESVFDANRLGGDASGAPKAEDRDDRGWVYLGNKQSTLTGDREWDGAAINRNLIGVTRTEFPYLVDLGEDLSYEFAISVTEKDSDPVPTSWSGQVNFRAYVVASGTEALWGLTSTIMSPESIDTFDAGVTTTTGRSIGVNGTLDYVQVRASFIDTEVPRFTNGTPTFTPGDTFTDLSFTMNRPGTVYYVIAPRRDLLSSEIVMKEDLKIATGSVSAGDKITTKPESEQTFWDVIDAQTKGDNPGDLRYTVQNEPPVRLIANAAQNYASYPSGTLSYPTGGARLNISLGGDNDGANRDYQLEPTTEYYIYMVIQGASPQLSELYIYNFTTVATAGPKIMLGNAGNGVASVYTPNVPGDLDYVVYPAGEVASNAGLLLLRTPLKNLALEGNLPTAYATYTDEEGKQQEMTVLQALITNYSDSTAHGGNSAADPYYPEGGTAFDGYSVFDAYASEGLKSQVATLIQQAAAGLATSSGKEVMTEKSESAIPFNNTTGMIRGTPYYVLALGRHPSSEDQASSYTFKAIGNIIIPDQDPPKAIEGTAVIYRPSGITDNIFSGSVTIQFDKELYWVENQTSTGKPKEIHQNCTQHSGDGGTAKNAKDLASTSAKITDLSGAQDRLTTTIRFGYENLRVGDNIIFPDYGMLANASGSRTNSKVTCVIRQGTTQTGQSGITLTGYYMEILWEGQRIAISEITT